MIQEYDYRGAKITLIKDDTTEKRRHLSKCEWRGPGYYCKEVEKKGVRIYGMN